MTGLREINFVFRSPFLLGKEKAQFPDRTMGNRGEKCGRQRERFNVRKGNFGRIGAVNDLTI